MQWFGEVPRVYLHREFVDFRKAVNGLCVIVEQQMQLNPFDASCMSFAIVLGIS